jgi:hypothetical protein
MDRTGPRLPLGSVAGCLDRDDGDDLEGERIHDHELIAEDEAPETPELRDDDHDVLGNHEQGEAARDEHANPDGEIDVPDAEPREVAVQHDVVDARALLGRERNLASRAGLGERLLATLGPGRAGLSAGLARSLQVLPMHPSLLGERLAAVALLSQRLPPVRLLGKRLATVALLGQRLTALAM